MMKRSAGILPYRRSDKVLQVLLVHPGGQFWQSRDLGVWSIAKGEYDEGELTQAAARANSRKRQAGSQMGRCSIWVSCASERANSSLLSRWKAISTPRRCAAT